MTTIKNVLLTDFKPASNWTFDKALSDSIGEPIIVRFCTSNGKRSKIGNLVRLIKYFVFPFIVLLQRKKYNRIIAYQQFYGLNLAFFARLFHLHKKNELIVLEFIYKKKKGIVGYIYHSYMQYIVSSKYIDMFVCFSQEECFYYAKLFNLPYNKFRFVLLGMEPIHMPLIDEKLIIEKYIFSTGRSNRDYDFLVNSLEQTMYHAKIACDIYKRQSTSHIIIENHCFNEDMLRYLASSYCVVIPLKDTKISAGQLVILQAMQFGKPIIITDSNGISDYIKDQHTGLIIKKDTQSLLEALDQLYSDSELYKRLSNNGKNEYEQKYSMNSMARNIGVLIAELRK